MSNIYPPIDGNNNGRFYTANYYINLDDNKKKRYNIFYNYMSRNIVTLCKSIAIALVIFTISMMICTSLLTIIYYIRKNNINIIKNIKGEKLKSYSYYIISYNSTIRLPNYGIYNLNTLSYECLRNNWKYDEDLDTRRETSYGDIVYNKGHLVPETDVKDSCSTYIMSNAIPQLECFKKTIWKNVEDYVRKNFINHNILTVPEYDNNKFIYDNHSDKLLIPTGFYKIVILDNNIIWNIYIEHVVDNCNKDFDKIGNKNKLPYFIIKNTSLYL